MEDERSRSGDPGATAVPLPPERAFVVQLRRGAEPGGEIFIGRVEHMASGAVLRFRSALELTDFIARICTPKPGSEKRSATAARPRSNEEDVQ
jgi:hypothetical protein